jgi:phospholipid/cholesterol/gamma-HCH transport system substrate-binding protein
MRKLGLLVKVVAFLAVTGLLTGTLIAIFGDFRVENATTYRAVFDDVSGMKPASKVKAAGVDLGRVDSLRRLPDNSIEVTFSLNNQVPLTTGTSAVVRYKDLVGNRYLQLSPGSGPAIPPGGTIPRSQTHPALDLDELYNGFTPLFQGLQPAQINQLSGALIEVLQGQGSAVDSLLSDLGSVTTTLADRGAVIDRVIGQLNTVLTTLNEQAPQLNDTIVNLQRLVSGLAADRDQIGGSVTGINSLTSSVSSLLAQERPDLKGTIGQLGRLAQNVNGEAPELANLFRRLPGYYVPLGRLGANQSAFQFYVCAVQIRITTPAGSIETPFIDSGKTPRCSV